MIGNRIQANLNVAFRYRAEVGTIVEYANGKYLVHFDDSNLVPLWLEKDKHFGVIPGEYISKNLILRQKMVDNELYGIVLTPCFPNQYYVGRIEYHDSGDLVLYDKDCFYFSREKVDELFDRIG